MNSSPELKNLFEALAKAQAEMPTAGLNVSNPFFKSKYANMAELVKASRPILSKNGLSVIQGTKQEQETTLIHTMLCHASGEWIGSSIAIKPSKAGAQEIGKELAYFRRYAYALITGVVASDDPDDDDLGAGQTNSYTPKQLISMAEKHITNSNVVDVISKDQLDELYHAIEQLPDNMQDETVGKIKTHYKITELKFLPKDKYRVVVDKIYDNAKELKK